MAGQSFRDLVAWQRAGDLAVDIYRAFRSNKYYGFKDQIQRAAVSIMHNIAEGYARRSGKAFGHFLSIAKGSAAGVDSMALIAERLGYIEKLKAQELLTQAEEVGRMPSGFITRLSAKSY